MIILFYFFFRELIENFPRTMIKKKKKNQARYEIFRQKNFNLDLVICSGMSCGTERVNGFPTTDIPKQKYFLS